MKISDKIVASYMDGFSGVYVYCPKEKMDEVASTFEKDFEEAWNNAMDAIEADYDASCDEKEEEVGIPSTIKKEKDRFLVELGPLYLMVNYGARADNEYGTEALENTLKELKKKYPDIHYEGVVAYEWYDEHCSDIVNYEISSEESEDNGKTYEFIRNTLHMVMNSKMFSEEFWEKMQDNLEDADEDDFVEVITNFHIYGLDAHLDRILDIAEESEEDIREVLANLIESWDSSYDKVDNRKKQVNF